MSTTLTSRDYYSMFCLLLIPCSNNCSVSWHVSQSLLSNLRFSFSIMTIFHKELWWSIVWFVYHYNMNFYFFIILILDCSIVIIIVGDCIAYNRDSMFRFLGVVNEKKKHWHLMHAVQNAKILNIISSIQVQILVRALRVLDILVIVIIVVIAAALIYIFWPLIVAIVIMAAGYFIYRWYMNRKRWNGD